MAGRDDEHLLSPQVDANLATLRTAATLQRHQEWVSQEARHIPDLLAAVGFTLVGEVINPITTGGQAYVALRDGQAVIAFRGSGGDNARETLLNALADARIRRVRPTALIGEDSRPHARVHIGFYESYLEFRHEIRSRLRALRGADLYVTGFSLGSALATLCAVDLATNDKLSPTLYGMGTPRVGNHAFIRLLEQRVPHTLRTVLTTDPVTRVPVQSLRGHAFLHAGNLLELHDDGTPVPLPKITGRLLDGHRISDHNRDRYAAMLASLVKRVSDDPRLLHTAWGDRPLQRTAQQERGPVVHDEDDDDDG